MKYDCEVIRDLLPLYADKACSQRSREMVEEHLRECAACRGMVNSLLQTEIEDSLHRERESVLDYGTRRFRRRSAAVGSAVSGAFAIPLLICLLLELRRGPTISWIYIVAAALCVVASVTVVPLTLREDKLLWTFCAFCASVVLLLGVVCLYSHGDWFRIASGGVLFGMSAIFLPFVIRTRPVKKLIGERNRLLIVLGVDVMLFFNLLDAVDTRGRFTFNNIAFALAAVGAIVSVVVAIVRNKKTSDDEYREERTDRL